MTKPILLTVNLPFDGFYNSVYSDAIDREEESFVEYRCDGSNGESDVDYESYWPAELQLDAGEYNDILMSVTDYRAAYQGIAESYVAAFDRAAGELLGLEIRDTRKRTVWTEGKPGLTYVKESYMRPSIRATFESMDSPREYNFGTDRVYAYVPLTVMRELFRRAKADNFEALQSVLGERFTSYDGFISGYSNRVPEWLKKPLRDWDHNELGSLLIAALKLAGDDVTESRSEMREAVMYDVLESETYSDWERAVDWSKFETKRTEARAEKFAEWLDDDAEAATAWAAANPTHIGEFGAVDASSLAGLPDMSSVPVRCANTPDMFTGELG